MWSFAKQSAQKLPSAVTVARQEGQLGGNATSTTSRAAEAVNATIERYRFMLVIRDNLR